MTSIEHGPLALVGSGEYLPVMQAIEGALLDGRPRRFVQLATAAAPEGDQSLARWHALGLAQAERLDVEQVVVDVRTQQDANDPALTGLISDAGLIYLSGGAPGFLAETLRGSTVWAAIEEAWRGGAALAGCSAGAMAMTSWVPSLRDLGRHPDPGLGLLPHLRVIPHFDKIAGWVPDIITRAVLRPPDGVTVLGIDEDTALVGGPHEWVVKGRQSVWVLGDGPRTECASGSTLVTPTEPAA